MDWFRLFGPRETNALQSGYNYVITQRIINYLASLASPVWSWLQLKSFYYKMWYDYQGFSVLMGCTTTTTTTLGPPPLLSCHMSITYEKEGHFRYKNFLRALKWVPTWCYGIGNPAGIGQGTGLGLRERERDGIGLGLSRLRTTFYQSITYLLNNLSARDIKVWARAGSISKLLSQNVLFKKVMPITHSQCLLSSRGVHHPPWNIEQSLELEVITNDK